MCIYIYIYIRIYIYIYKMCIYIYIYVYIYIYIYILSKETSGVAQATASLPKAPSMSFVLLLSVEMRCYILCGSTVSAIIYTHNGRT